MKRSARRRFGNTAEEALLIAATRWPHDASAVSDAAVRISDWPYFELLVARHRVTPLVVQALTVSKVAVPNRLMESARQITRQTLNIIAASIRLAKGFEQNGIKTVALKGPALSQRLYGVPTQREMHDCDLLVAPDDFMAARALLEDQGFVAVGAPAASASAQVIRAWMGQQKDVYLIDVVGEVVVELHHRLRPNAAILTGLGVRNATETVSLGAHPMRFFDNRDLFAYLAAHGTEHLWFRLKWVADLQVLLGKFDQRSIETLYQHACALGVGRSSRIALALTRQLYGQPLPPTIEAAIADDPQVDRWLNACHLAMFAPAERSLLQVAQDRVRMLSFEDNAEFRSVEVANWWHDWRLESRIPLPKSLNVLYRPLRLLDVMVRNGHKLLLGSSP